VFFNKFPLWQKGAKSCNIRFRCPSAKLTFQGEILSEDQKPKYQQIVAFLRRAIATGEYQPGQKLPSEADLVKRFSTSRLTVQRALKELQHQDLIERRAGSGTYVRQGESPEKSHVFGLLIPGLGETEIFEPICQGMARAGRAGSNSLMWGDTTQNTQDKEKQTRDLCEYYIAREVSGIFFAPLELTPGKDDVNQWVVETLGKAGIPVVLLDRCIYRYPRRSAFDLVGIDNRRAGFLVTEHLLRHDCRSLMFVAKPNSASTVDARILGFRDALGAFESAAVTGEVHLGDPDDTASIRVAVSNLSPDGIVCANDATAAHLMQTLQALGIAVPKQIRMVGIDDVKYAGLLGVPLTTLHQPCREIGEMAISTMLERIANPELPARDILLDCKLVIRRSCGSHPREEPS
jgi:GntR family transcriptional regulator, arabinose operon transcriptional repressor